MPIPIAKGGAANVRRALRRLKGENPGIAADVPEIDDGMVTKTAAKAGGASARRADPN
jgi:hypothetical protein